jgi:hypothetical protein
LDAKNDKDTIFEDIKKHFGEYQNKELKNLEKLWENYNKIE